MSFPPLPTDKNDYVIGMPHKPGVMSPDNSV